jgi:hypothetical protein
MGNGNTSTKPRDYLLFKGNGSKGSNGDWTMSVLEHHVLIIRRFIGTGTVLGLGSWGDFFVGVLVFVILNFFEEGIGNNLTMPSGSWVWVLNLGSWKWVLGLGTWVRDFWY